MFIFLIQKQWLKLLLNQLPIRNQFTFDQAEVDYLAGGLENTLREWKAEIGVS